MSTVTIQGESTTTDERRSYVKFDEKVAQVVTFLKENPNATSKEIGIAVPDLHKMVEAGMIQTAGVRRHGADNPGKGRGRPMFEFKNARKGSDKARRIAKAAAKASA